MFFFVWVGGEAGGGKVRGGGGLEEVNFLQRIQIQFCVGGATSVSEFF